VPSDIHFLFDRYAETPSKKANYFEKKKLSLIMLRKFLIK